MKIIIPLSGQGKRFVEAGYSDPKPLIKANGKPMIEHVVNLFPGEKDLIAIANRTHAETTPLCAILESLGAKVYIIHNHSLGPVYAVTQILEAINDDEEVIISYTDYGTDWDYKAFRAMCGGRDGIIVAYKGFHPHMLFGDNYAFLRMDGDKVAEVREKESFTSNKMEEYASNGTYYFRRGEFVKKYFKILMEKGVQKNGEYYVSLVYNLMIADGLNIGVFEIQRMLQWGTPRDLEIYNAWADVFSRKQTIPKSKATLILPMAGRGSRFSMVGYTEPKPFLPVNNQPMIVSAVSCLPNCEKKYFITLNEHLRSHALATTLCTAFENVEIIGIYDVTEGQACTSAIAVERLSPQTPILISACDNGVMYDAEKYAALEADPSIDVIVWSFSNNPTSKLYPHMYAWLDVGDGDCIKHVSVKKYFSGAQHAIIGTMYFRTAETYNIGYTAIREANIRTNGEFYVDDLLNPLIEKGYKVVNFSVDHYLCWGTPNDYKTYNYYQSHFAHV